MLTESAFAIKAAVNLPLQGQCEPPDDHRWFQRMFAAGIDTLGMHLEVVTPAYPTPISYRGHYYQRSGSTLQELKGAALDHFLLRR